MKLSLPICGRADQRIQDASFRSIIDRLTNPYAIRDLSGAALSKILMINYV